ncbi:hypothetical protein [Bradyrhizobium sp. BR 10261]|uniref:hypothetical protein n=1 Tax=Bradyrhizobium sp. BR 10261 TaxID=2749992 RepID=UPI001C6529CD|nr:hypothetical protein [Bradyrhizobium sp. BR 10261]MBW7964057.1 hypothetical protein [Bradyrhizobium sp. BR 10261]
MAADMRRLQSTQDGRRGLSTVQIGSPAASPASPTCRSTYAALGHLEADALEAAFGYLLIVGNRFVMSLVGGQ